MNQKLHSGLFLELRFLAVHSQMPYFAVAAPAEIAFGEAVVAAAVAAIVAADVALAPRSKKFQEGRHFSSICMLT